MTFRLLISTLVAEAIQHLRIPRLWLLLPAVPDWTSIPVANISDHNIGATFLARGLRAFAAAGSVKFGAHATEER